jgi:hypothetical protein
MPKTLYVVLSSHIERSPALEKCKEKPNGHFSSKGQRDRGQLSLRGSNMKCMIRIEVK